MALVGVYSARMLDAIGLLSRRWSEPAEVSAVFPLPPPDEPWRDVEMQALGGRIQLRVRMSRWEQKAVTTARREAFGMQEP